MPWHHLRPSDCFCGISSISLTLSLSLNMMLIYQIAFCLCALLNDILRSSIGGWGLLPHHFQDITPFLRAFHVFRPVFHLLFVALGCELIEFNSSHGWSSYKHHEVICKELQLALHMIWNVDEIQEKAHSAQAQTLWNSQVTYLSQEFVASTSSYYVLSRMCPFIRVVVFASLPSSWTEFGKCKKLRRILSKPLEESITPMLVLLPLSKVRVWRWQLVLDMIGSSRAYIGIHMSTFLGLIITSS